jgi:formiminotetrahydrofolate cyclodeaminase
VRAGVDTTTYLLTQIYTETLETSAANLSRRKKKKEYNDVELALKKEEMARKRKNLSEKRLQDEQVHNSTKHIETYHSR